MKRVFGAKQDKQPLPALNEASDQINRRGESVDEKIKRLDGEHARYKVQIKRTRPGPAQKAAKARAMRVLKQKRMYEGQRDMLYNQTFNLDQIAVASEGIKDAQQTIKNRKTIFFPKDKDKEEEEPLKKKRKFIIDIPRPLLLPAAVDTVPLTHDHHDYFVFDDDDDVPSPPSVDIYNINGKTYNDDDYPLDLSATHFYDPVPTYGKTPEQIRQEIESIEDAAMEQIWGNGISFSRDLCN